MSYQTIRQSLRYLREYKSDIILSLILGGFVSIIGIVPPYLVKLFVDVVYVVKDLDLLAIVAGVLLSVSIYNTITSAVQSYVAAVISAKIRHNVMSQYSNHLLRLPYRFYEERQIGDILSRYHDVRKTIELSVSIIYTLTVNVVFVVVIPVVLIVLSPTLGLIASVSIPLSVVAINLFRIEVSNSWKEVAESNATLSDLQIASVSNILKIKSSQLEDYAYRLLVDHTRTVHRATVRANAKTIVSTTIGSIIKVSVTVIIGYCGWRLVLLDALTLGEYFAFVSYVSMLFGPLQSSIQTISLVHQSEANVSRMKEYMDVVGESLTPCEAIDITHSIPIDLSSVTFSRGEGKSAVKTLDNISFQFRSGLSYAIVGQTGSGKTTLLQIMDRIHAPSGGHIKYYGKESTSCSIEDVRSLIAVAWQHAEVFPGLINSVICGTNVELARLMDVITLCELQDLYESIRVTERATPSSSIRNMSGGQRQRLLIASALYRNTPVLLLDEPTAHLNDSMAQRIIGNILGSYKNGLVVVATHDKAIAEACDCVLFMRKGKLVDYGSHAELSRTNIDYHTLYHPVG